MKDVLGGKGAGLAEMCRAGVPVPPGFTISTEVCNIYFQNNKQVPDEINEQMLTRRSRSSKSRSARSWAIPTNPLLVSVRSGAKFSMPGMMNTILNLGLNDATTEGLAKLDRQSALRLRFLSPLHPDVRRSGAGHRHGEVRRHLRRAQSTKRKVKLDTDLTADDLKAIIADYKKLVQKETKKPFPQDAHEQLAMSRDAVFRSWWNPKASYYRKMEKIPDEIGTAANVQAMVFGNLGDTSATGVGFTRDPATGENIFYGEFLVNAQGEDVVAGIRTPEPISDLEKIMPDAYNAAARDHHQAWKSITSDMQDFEFTIEDNKLYMLQTRNGKRTGPAAVRVAVEMVRRRPDRLRRKPCCAWLPDSSISFCTRCSMPRRSKR